MPFFRKKPKIAYDPLIQEPAVRRSVCTGEMTVGFIDRKTGRFTGIMRADGQKDLDAFCREIGAQTLKTIY